MDAAPAMIEEPPRPVVPVQAKFIYVFESLFKTVKGARRILKWKDFLKAMGSVGFAHKPATGGGAARVFWAAGTQWQTNVVLHEPHDGELGPAYQNEIAHLLNTAYGWEGRDFVVRA
ncbi:hypothetical protein L226DRAFT_572646 [Lentinus tigrinus ALCF2SS1-7]|uniref:Uncharacterized protein n=1 Tax=Lentinus tigrinus ALCF2SS1-6 TaxID=1328759 RepID=A0A5C2RM59_9APHY|nr:hypothetical protein L227DRAFT_568707 [Lentinus tigrinus ALCF2SS1-6]RPD73215.1 hypothetical protein L226DRAFT_572646 [Lentinus tigrinus ALCF2SS1-7]